MSNLEGISWEDLHPWLFLVEMAALENQTATLVKEVMVKMETVVIWLDPGMLSDQI
jgi:hypothetical protein